MNSLTLPVAVVSSLALILMVIAMLYLVWISMGDETHRPAVAGGDRPEIDADRSEVDGSDREGDQPEVAESETA